MWEVWAPPCMDPSFTGFNAVTWGPDPAPKLDPAGGL